jgi:hypothetical protein
MHVATMLFELDVEMEGEATYVVVADQRDVARWEIQSFGWPASQIEEKASMQFFRFLGWSASVRQQKTMESWDAWSARCIEVLPVDEEESELEPDAEDPGRTVL